MRAVEPRPPSTAPERRSTNLLAVVQRLLWPLVKLLLHRGIPYPAVENALKSVFVRVAVSEFAPTGRRETDSRISVLTGIYRRDVKRLRQEHEASAANAKSGGSDDFGQDEISLSSMVVAIWTSKALYLGEDGAPRPLPRLERHGGRRSFEALVRSVNRDVRPRALLEVWLRRGAVSLDADDRVCLNLDAFMAHKRADEKAFFLGQNVHDHIAAVAHNLTGGQPPLLERCVYYGRLTDASAQELAQLAREAGMEALQKVNKRAMQLQKRDAGKPGATRRINFGLYFYRASARADGDEGHEGS